MFNILPCVFVDIYANENTRVFLWLNKELTTVRFAAVQ